MSLKRKVVTAERSCTPGFPEAAIAGDLLYDTVMASASGERGPGSENVELLELAAKQRRRLEMDAVDAQRGRGGGIRGVVVDEHRLFRRDRVALEEDAEDARVGLDHALVAGDDDAVEPREETGSDGAAAGTSRPTSW